MLTLVMFSSVMVYAAEDTYSDGQLTYTTDYLKDTSGNFGDYYRVSACSNAASGVVSVKSQINGVPVVNISKEVFKGKNHITEVSVPSTVAKIEDNAFENCAALVKVTIASGNCEFGKNVFYNCGNLETITLPSNITSIPQKTFLQCVKLNSITIPASVTYIGTEAFSLCKSIETITIPASVTTIATNAFANCGGIKKFIVASGNRNYKAVNDCLYTYDGKTLVQFPNGCGKISFSVPAGTQALGNYSMGANSVLKSVTLPSGLTTIDAYAFLDDTALSSINIPSTVTTIGSMAFARCSSLKSITIPASVTSFDGAFYQSGIETVTLADGIKKIDTKAFEGCASLKTVNIPSSVTIIGNGAFSGCSSLTSLEIPASVTTIGTNAFLNCPNVKLVVEKGSAAQTYADNNSIPYSIKGEEPVVTVASIAVNTPPSKTEYMGGDTISTSGLTIKVTYSDGSTKTVSSGFSISPTKASGSGTRPVTVTYQGKTATFNIKVKNVTSVTVESSPAKTNYVAGDKIEVGGMKLKVTYDDGTTACISEGFTVSPSVASGNGTTKVTVTVNGKSTTFNITVYDPEAAGVEVKSIKVSKQPATTSYRYKANFDKTGMELSVTFADGTVKTVTSGFTVTPSYFDSVGDKTLTVEYKGATTTLNVNVSYTWWQILILILLLGFLWY